MRAPQRPPPSPPFCAPCALLQIFFAKVLRSATEDEVRALFSGFGKVYDVNLFRAFQGAPTTKVRARPLWHLLDQLQGAPPLHTAPSCTVVAPSPPPAAAQGARWTLWWGGLSRLLPTAKELNAPDPCPTPAHYQGAYA